MAGPKLVQSALQHARHAPQEVLASGWQNGAQIDWLLRPESLEADGDGSDEVGV